MEDSRNFFPEELLDGSHSNEYVNEIVTYANNLRKKNLPLIYSTKHLSLLVGIEYIDLKRLITNRIKKYHFYQIRKKKGGFREISVPHKDLKFIQNWIKVNIFDKVEIPANNYSHAYLKNKSIYTNALPHSNSEIVLNIDLKKFFDSITETRVYSLFKYLGFSTNLSVDLAKICTCPISNRYFETFEENEMDLFQNIFDNHIGVLPQGACTSPSISNLICTRIDKRFFAYSLKNNIKYTRYSDDITFSGNKNNLPNLSLIKKIISEENFFINYNKISYKVKGQRQMVTGLVVNESVKVPKKFKREIYRHLHFCIKFTPAIHFKFLADKENVSIKGFQKEWLLGKIRYVYSIEQKEGIKMFKLYEKIKWAY
jgi:RNA-directed DNA polymerase